MFPLVSSKMNPSSLPLFDPARFPRTYTASLGWRVFALVSGASGFLALVGAGYFASGHEWKGVGPRW
jgi:hypothetical protein